MKESRTIIIISLVMIVASFCLHFVLISCGINKDLSFNIITNLICGAIVGLVTAICQYFIAKSRIINSIYGVYFDLYRTCYLAKTETFLFHYNMIPVYKKIVDISPKINELVSEYHGFLHWNGVHYSKINLQINIGDEFKIKNIKKTIFRWFNGKQSKRIIESTMNYVERILQEINKKRFEADKHQMTQMFKYICE